MSGAQTTAGDVDVDLRHLFASLLGKWRRLVFVAVAVTGAAFVLASMAPPKYRSETRLLIETRESVFTRPGGSGDERPILDEEGVTSQVEVISSSDILKQVAKKLDLASRPEFDTAAEMSTISRLLVIAGLKSDPNELPAEERVLKAISERLAVYRVEKSRVIVIQFSSQDPKLAADVPNAVAEVYLEYQRKSKFESNTEATDWLKPEIADLSKRVKDAEAKVAAFRAQADLLVGQNNSVLATQQLSELSSELSRVRASRSAAEATAQRVHEALENGGSLDAMPEVLSSGLIQRLRERQIQLRNDIADLSTSLLPNHPRIKALNSQLADLNAQIRTQAEKVLNGLVNEASTADLRERQLIADLNTLKVEFGARLGTGGRIAGIGARGGGPARVARILPDPVSRGLVAPGPQLSSGRCARLFARPRAFGTLLPEDRAGRGRGLRWLAAGDGDRHASPGTVLWPRHAPGTWRTHRSGGGGGHARPPGGEPA